MYKIITTLLGGVILLSGYSLGEKKSQYFIRWGITIASHLDTVMLRHVDSVAYTSGSQTRYFKFYFWIPYKKIGIKKVVPIQVNTIGPQRKVGWVLTDKLGVFKTSSLDMPSILSFSSLAYGEKIVYMTPSYKITGGAYIPDVFYMVDSLGILWREKSGAVNFYVAFKDTINDTLPEGTLIDTLVRHPLKILSCGVPLGIADTFVYVGTTEGVYKGINKNYYYKTVKNSVIEYWDYDSLWITPDSFVVDSFLVIDTVQVDSFYVAGDYLLEWHKIGDLTDTVSQIFVSYDESYILAIEKDIIRRWNGSVWNQVFSGPIINEIKFYDDTLFIATSNGVYYSADNGISWLLYPYFQNEDVVSFAKKIPGLYTIGGNYFAVIRGEGLYDELGNHYTDGLGIFVSYGALNGNSVDFDLFGRLWYGSEAGLFYLEQDTVGVDRLVFKFNMGLDEKYDPNTPHLSKTIGGINVSDILFENFVNDFMRLFYDNYYIDIGKILEHFKNRMGVDFPVEHIHLVFNPYVVTPPTDDPVPYFPYDILPVTLFNMFGFKDREEQSLKDAVYVKVGFQGLGAVGGWLSLNDIEKRGKFVYILNNVGIFNIKENENKLIRAGLNSVVTTDYFVKRDSLFLGDTLEIHLPEGDTLYLYPPVFSKIKTFVRFPGDTFSILEVEGLKGVFDLVYYYDSVGTNGDFFKFSEYHGKSEPIPNKYSKARMFTFFEFLKERWGWNLLRGILQSSDTGWGNINTVLKNPLYVPDTIGFVGAVERWALSNAIDEKIYPNWPPDTTSVNDYYYKRIKTLPHIEPTLLNRYNFVFHGPYSYVVYEHIPEGNNVVCNFEIENNKNVVLYLVNYKHVYSDSGQVIGYKLDNIEKLSPKDSKRNFYSVVLSDSSKQKIVVINLEPLSISTARGRDTIPPYPLLFVVQHPVVDNSIDIYVWNNRRIYLDAVKEGGILKITKEGLVVDSIKEFKYIVSGAQGVLFNASYKFERQNAVYTLAFSAQDTVGNLRTTVLDVSVFNIGPTGGVFSNVGNDVMLTVPEGAVTGSVLSVVSKVPKEKGEIIAKGSSEGASEIFVIGRNGKKLLKEFTIKIKSSSLKDNTTGIFVYKENFGWIPVPCVIDRDKGEAVIKTNTFGWFQVRKGKGTVFGSAPVLKIPAVMTKGKNNIIFVTPHKVFVDFSLYNVAGRKVVNIFKGYKGPGFHEMSFSVPVSGIYFFVGKVDKDVLFKKKVIIYPNF